MTTRNMRKNEFIFRFYSLYYFQYITAPKKCWQKSTNISMSNLLRHHINTLQLQEKNVLFDRA